MGTARQSVDDALVLRDWGRADYLRVFAAMQAFTEARDGDSRDELWLVEHPPVYTQGVAGKPEHILNPSGIPVVPVNRGGQVTYHGPGQVVIYCLLDIRRRRMAVRELVSAIERAMVAALAKWGVSAAARPDAPGVYVEGAKIGSIGLRVTGGCTYHGLSFNVDMDLAPFAGINPCGYAGMAVTQLLDHVAGVTCDDAQRLLVESLLAELHYNGCERADAAAIERLYADAIQAHIERQKNHER
ncbi:MAG: lipoyl(octanoyl) transferase LipB [Pseudomonadota bacterium]